MELRETLATIVASFSTLARLANYQGSRVEFKPKLEIAVRVLARRGGELEFKQNLDLHLISNQN